MLQQKKPYVVKSGRCVPALRKQVKPFPAGMQGSIFRFNEWFSECDNDSRQVILGSNVQGSTHMTDKQLKHLSRVELIDIIFELQKQKEAAEARAEELQKKLEERELHIAESGSIAEAALRINGIFEAAQAAAEQYLISVRANAERQQSDSRPLEAESGSDNADAARRETAADEMTEQEWDSIDQRIQEIMSALTASKGKRTDEGKE